MILPNAPFSFIFCGFLSICGWTLLQSCQNNASQPKEKIERYDQGQIKRRTQMAGDKKEGKMLDYYPDGKLRGERFFVNDQQTGRTVWYFRNGNIKEVQYFAEGQKQGGDTLWYESGEVQFSVDFKDSKKHGYFRKWSKTGDLLIEARYELDSLREVTKGMLHAGDAMQVDTTLKLREATLQDASGG